MPTAEQISAAYKKLGIEKKDLITRIEKLAVIEGVDDYFRTDHGRQALYEVAKEATVDHIVYTASKNIPTYIKETGNFPVSLDSFEKLHLFSSNLKEIIKASRPGFAGPVKAKWIASNARKMASDVSRDVRQIESWSFIKGEQRVSVLMTRELLIVLALTELTNGFRTFDAQTAIPAKDIYVLASEPVKRAGTKLGKSGTTDDAKEAGRMLVGVARFIASRPPKERSAQIRALLRTLESDDG